MNIVIKAWLSRRGYQGVAGAGQTTPIGLLLATMLLATGNLLLPMAVMRGACNVGLRVRVLLPKGFALAEEKVVNKLIEVKSPS